MSLWSLLFVIVLVAVVPYLSARSLGALDVEDLSRIALYGHACASLWVLAALGYLVVKLDRQALADVHVRGAPAAPLLGWTLALTAAGVLLAALLHVARRRLGLGGEDRLVLRIRPTNTAEALWAVLALCPSAGICEEFLYRGFLLSRATDLLGPGFLAVALSSVAFGCAHLYQGGAGALRAALISLPLAASVVALGTLLPAVLAHVLIDALALLWLGPLLERAWPPADAVQDVPQQADPRRP